MNREFKDHFSGHAADYATYRPSYPRELFAYLGSVSPSRERVWDCATGNGQAARGLTEFFHEIIATDASEKQIASAGQQARVRYRLALAEQSGLAPASVDLVTVAQALHWLNLGAFYAEAKRVLKPNGILAVWCYNLFHVAPEIDALLEKYYRETVGPFWDFERKLVETGYGTIEFPFAELSAPNFRMQAEWTLDHLLGYVRTWSATKAFIAAHGSDPVCPLGADILPFWGNPASARVITWPLHMRVGSV
jgi:SAM-dependent methyltransferase